MRQQLNRFLAATVLVLFVNFMFSNIVFMHTHEDAEGRTIVHSHPYTHATGHTHSAQSYSQISGFNIAASSAQASGIYELDTPCPVITSGYAPSVLSGVPNSGCNVLSLRAPPVA